MVNISKRLFLLAAFGLMLSPTPLIIAASSVAQPGSIMGNLLRYRMGLSVADLRVLAAGSPVIKSLDTPVREELAYVGVVYINTPAQHYIDRFRDIEQFESGSGVPQIGKFSSVPRLEDLASLTLPALDVEALSKCRPGDCDVKLSANAMRRFRDEVAWASPNAAAQANEVAREIILDLVSRYQVDGNIALGDYHDGSEPLSVTEQFRSLLTSRTPMPVSVPEFWSILTITRTVVLQPPKTFSIGRWLILVFNKPLGSTMSLSILWLWGFRPVLRTQLRSNNSTPAIISVLPSSCGFWSTTSALPIVAAPI